jgi:hypothetical protein
MAEDRRTHQTDPAKVKPGDLMAIIHYVKVNAINGARDQMDVAPLEKMGTNIKVTGRDLIANALSADYFAEEVTTTMTDVAEKLVTSHNRPLTVCFIKQAKKGEEDGEERVLRGRLVKHESLLGRSYVEDLDKTENDRIRLVDHRTIRWLVVDGVKYTVKGKK